MWCDVVAWLTLLTAKCRVSARFCNSYFAIWYFRFQNTMLFITLYVAYFNACMALYAAYFNACVYFNMYFIVYVYSNFKNIFLHISIKFYLELFIKAATCEQCIAKVQLPVENHSSLSILVELVERLHLVARLH